MANTNTKSINTKNTNGADVEVLYQKMGDRWFAFSMIGDDVFMGSLTQEEIDTAERLAAAKAKRDSKRRTPSMGGNA